MSSAKRNRQRANRQARADADQPIPVVSDADLDQFLAPGDELAMFPPLAGGA